MIGSPVGMGEETLSKIFMEHYLANKTCSSTCFAHYEVDFEARCTG